MEYYSFLLVVIYFMIVLETCVATYRSDVPTFHVGSIGKTTLHCPCTEMNATFSRACGVTPKVTRLNATDSRTQFGEFPWQVAVIEKYEEEFICSGVLVSPRVVLTAAQCVQEIPVSQIKVRLGEWDILNEDKNPFEPYTSVDVPVSKKYLNTESRILSEAYNLAILKLVVPINFDEYPHVAPICLPQITMGKANLSDCMVTGWIESDVLTLEKQVQSHLVNSMSQTFGMWKNPMESATNSPEGSHCQLLGGNFGELVHCSPEIGGITGIENSSEEQFEREKLHDNMSDEEEAETRIFSRILSKSRATVLSRAECIKAMKEINSTMPKSNQLCVTAMQGSSQCLGDIGSPVICRLIEEKKQNLKDIKKTDEGSIKYVVVGIMTQSYNCIGDDSDTNVRPLLATSISKNLDQICHVMSSS
ncbi:clotting factor G beta subunit-like [Ischnura elegans]|uniref:clotting factor G beta subunit-like n=1 Tax=Ischnura elegans TaxID=197161 RepID=UPI001ED8A47E|nr:clotting factor G beta subunit-like [Ischnura elegans]